VRRCAALVALLASSCVMRAPTVGDPAPTLSDLSAEREYMRVLERYSARAEMYHLFDTRAFVAATLLAPTFREAKARRLAAFRSETPSELEARLEQARVEAAQAHEFFVGMHVNEPRYDDLDRANSIWRIALVTPAGEVLPTRVERVGRSSLDMRAIYPYMDPFWVGYRVRFPREVAGQPVVPPGTEQVVLQIASTLGKANLVVAAP
jgi:hypothetical protein